MRRPSLDGSFAAVMGVALLSATAIHGVRPMATYRALGLGAGPVEIGLIASAFSILGLIAALPLGRWVDRVGEGPFILAGMLLIAGSSFIGGSTDSLGVLAASQALMGLGHILSLLALQTLVAGWGGSAGRDERFGQWTAAVSLGQLVGPATAGLLVSSVPVTGLAAGANREAPAFAFAGIAAGLAAVIALVLLRHGGHHPDRRIVVDEGHVLRVAGRLLRRPGMASAMLVSVIVISSVDVLIAYLPAFGEANGLAVGFVAGLLSLRAAASLFSRLFMGRLVRAFGRRAFLSACLAAGATAISLSAFMPWPGVLVVALLVVGFGLGVGQPMTIAWVADRSPRAERATAIGLRLTGNRAALLAAPAAMGLVAGAAGLAAIFWFLGAANAVAAWIAWTGRMEDIEGETELSEARLG